MAGLDENKMYKVKELDVIDNKPLDCEGKSYSGKYLMEHGLEMPYVHEVDWVRRTTGRLVFSIWRQNSFLVPLCICACMCAHTQI